MTAPADRPAVARLTDDAIAAIERDHARVAAGVPSIWPDAVALAYIPMLVAEVRRLQAIEALARALVWHIPTVEVGEAYTYHQCGYCQQLDAHDEDCPWERARLALATGGPRAGALVGAWVAPGGERE